MPILPIYLCNDKILREKASLCVKPFSQYKDLIDNMIQTMYKAPGIGLAAPQIGLPLRIFVYDIGNGINICINPEILETSGEESVFEEGCLSVPEITANVIRPAKIKISAYDLNEYKYEKELSDLEARVFQHEFDHLNGVLFIDRLDKKEKSKVEKKLKSLGIKFISQKVK